MYENAEKMLKVLDEGGIDVIRELGIKGHMIRPKSCLVARYLSHTVGGMWSVGIESCYFQYEMAWSPKIQLPGNVMEIVNRFDFQVGDRVKGKATGSTGTVKYVYDSGYIDAVRDSGSGWSPHLNPDRFELVSRPEKEDFVKLRQQPCHPEARRTHRER
jgi:hypothetical protein